MRPPLVRRRPRRPSIAATLAIGLASLLAAVPVAAHAQTGTVVGQVTDAQAQAGLAGATIQVEGTQLGAAVTGEGRYRIPGVPAGPHTLVARRLGYTALRQSVTVPAGGEVTANFALQSNPISLEQVVVTGTAGAVQKREVGNAVATINASEDLTKSAAPNITSLVGARAPGVTIRERSGRLGAGPSIEIRGRSSLSLDNSPLIYIDGVRVNNATSTGPVGVSGGLGGQGATVAGRLNDINPDDIESIQIIKGPAAATIYGTEAANGVIQIITKKGAAGARPQVNLQVQEGSLYFRNAAGRIPTNYDKDPSGNIVTWNGYQQETDSGRAFYRTGQTRQYNGSVSGGRDNLRYYLASAYENDLGIESNNSLRQFTLHANLNTQLVPSTEVATSLNYVSLSNHLGADVGASPLLGAEVGHRLLFPATRGFFAVPPEVAQQLYDNADGINRFTGSGTVTNSPTSWFTHRAIVGLDYTGEDARAIEFFAPPDLAKYVTAAAATGRIGQTLRHNSIASADYNGTAHFNLASAFSSRSSVGGQFYRTELNSSFLGGTAFPAPGVETVSGATAPVASTQTETINTTIGGYGEQQFGWHDRLFLGAGVRVDNNSAFGENFKWITYPKFSASWVIGEEPFWQRFTNVVNTLRLRAAYGESGRQPNAFAALRTFSPRTGPGGASAVTPASLGNPDLKPERGKEWELGFETGFFNRLTVDFTYFTKRTLDEIVSQPVAPSSGFAGNTFRNLGRVDNHGIEVNANLRALTMRNVVWEFAGNVGTNHDEIKSLGGLPSLIASAGFVNVVGYPIQGVWAKRVVSADRNTTTGLATNVLCDGGPSGAPVACAQAPFVFIGTSTPKVIGSTSTTLTLFNRLRLYALADFKRGNVFYNATEQLRCTGAVGAPLCRANYFPLDYDPVYLAEAVGTASATGTIDQYFQSGSFVKLRELSATYTVPEKWTRSRIAVTLAARELHTWTKYRGLDPEANVNSASSTAATSDQAVTPPLQRLIATINVTW